MQIAAVGELVSLPVVVLAAFFVSVEYDLYYFVFRFSYYCFANFFFFF